MIESVPMAIGIAATPFAIIPAIVLLLTPRPRAAASAFLAAWFLAVVVIAGIAVATADVTDANDAPASWSGWVRIVLGTALVVLGIRKWLKRSPDAKPPAWLTAIESATPGKAFTVGLMLTAANPKMILLAVAGGVAIGAHPSAVPVEVLHVVLFAAIASSTVALPLLAYLIAPARAIPVLQSLRGWLMRHADTMIAIVVIVIGLVVVAEGLATI